MLKKTTYKVKLSRHAIERIISREGDRETVKQLTMTPEEVLRLLENRAFVATKKKPVVGERPNLKYTYWLFYSVQDHAHFVAIGGASPLNEYEIITVIPLSNPQKWGVKRSHREEAKLLACNEIGFSFLKFSKANPEQTKIPPSSYKVGCLFMNDTGVVCRKGLGTIKIEDVCVEMDQLIKMPEFIESCVEIASSKGIKKSAIKNIMVRLKDSDAPVFVDVN